MLIHNLYMQMAIDQEKLSNDLERKVGACLVNYKGQTIIGYNKIPDHLEQYLEYNNELHSRPIKYYLYDHAEKIVISKAIKLNFDFKDACLYVTYFPCSDCARLITEYNIKKIITNSRPNFNHERWGKSFYYSNEILKISGVEIIYV